MVVIIIGILTSLGVGGYSLAQRAAKEGQAKADIEIIRNALEEYRIEFGAYPGDLSALTKISVGGDLNPMDPWGRDYHYASSNRFSYSIWSDGFDLEDDADNIDPSRVGY